MTFAQAGGAIQDDAGALGRALIGLCRPRHLFHEVIAHQTSPLFHAQLR